MDTNENQELDPMTGQEITEQEATQEPAEQAAEEAVGEVTEQAPETGVYRGAGAGQKESPYANSPYYSYAEMQNMKQEPAEEPTEEAPAEEAPAEEIREPKAAVEEAPVVEKPRKQGGKLAKRIVAAVAAVAVVAGSCAITAAVVNDRWEDRLDKLEDSFEDRLEDLQDQIDRVDDITVSADVIYQGMSPSQVYAKNVDAVVGVTSFVKSSGRNGKSSGLTTYSTGSGFFISEDGYAVTNYHVVEGADALTVTTYGGEEYEATLIGYDSINDVAVLKVDATGLDYAVIGSSASLNVGDMVMAVGNALGELTYTMTVGYVSGMDRSVSTDGSAINMLQTDAAINSGNSGGPLFNMNGEVIGITTAKYSGETSSGASIEGIGFAIPIDDVSTLIDDLVNYGYNVSQAYLGVGVLEMDSTTAFYYSLPVGAYVQTVEEGYSADRAGVLPGDIIIAVGDYEVSGLGTLQVALRKFTAGDTSTITVYRGGQEVTMEITFDQRPADLDSDTTEEQEQNEMPDSGDYEEWYDYFFGDQGSN